ncbi:VWA domain-containing protein, partial [Halarcobacter sp.]|uniref:VWA domain-containing protein n=1 Tax=Halarcobacter sp. TaxID=2321133 RepID=UPI003A93BD8D
FTITTPTVDDALKEDTEAYEISVGGVDATGTILDNEATPTITLSGSEVFEVTDGTATGDKVKGLVTATIDVALSEDLTITLSSGDTILIEAGKLTGSIEVETSRVDDAYDQGETKETVTIDSISNDEIDITNKEAVITIKDDNDPVSVTVTAVATSPKIIDVDTEFGEATGINVTAYDIYGNEGTLSVVKGTNHDGFGVLGKTSGSGDSSELGHGKNGVSEKIVFTFDNDADSLDVAFAWRHNGETAVVTFSNNGQELGYAKVSGGGSNTDATVSYYDIHGNLIKSVQAQGGTDRVDLSYTFEFPDENGNPMAFDKVEFSAPGYDDDYLINKISYTEVIDPEITNIDTSEGKVTFNIQVDENYPPQGQAKAIVLVNGFEYEVDLNATGRGSLTVDAKDFDDLSNINIVVKDIVGGNYEDVEETSDSFDLSDSFKDDLSSTDDQIVVDEDTSYTLTETDFGELGKDVVEFKITELPENGTLYYKVTKGQTVIDKEGNTHVVTEDTTIEIAENQVISLADIASGKVTFTPDSNSDEDGSFKFKVGDEDGNFTDEEYTTIIDVLAVADAPEVSISVGEPLTIVPSVNELPKGSGISHVNYEFSDGTRIKLEPYNDTKDPTDPTKYIQAIEESTGKTIVGYEIKGGTKIFDEYGNYLRDVTSSDNKVDTYEGPTTQTDTYVFGSSLEYSVDISAALTDIDGSETLSVKISGVPEGATFDSNLLVDEGNGEWSLTISEDVTNISYSDIKMIVPEGTDNVNLTITATATEKRDNEDEQNFETSTDSDATVSSVDETQNIVFSEKNTNLVLTIDVSGSMNDKLSLAKTALTNMINKYDDLGQVKVLLTVFSGYANVEENNSGSVWLSASEAIDIIDDLSANGGTNYDDALLNVIDELKENPAPLDGDTVSYFVSDGEPTYGMHYEEEHFDWNKWKWIDEGWYRDGNGSRLTDINDSIVEDWKDLGFDKTYSVGLGTNELNSYLREISQNPDDDVIIVENANSLNDVLQDTVSTSVEGNVIDNVEGGDSNISIDTIKIDNIEYSKDSFPEDGLSINGDGTLIFDFDTGDYKYTSQSNEFENDTIKSFEIIASDEDGDSTSFDVNIVIDVPETNSNQNILDIDGDIDLSELPRNSLPENVNQIDLTNDIVNELIIDEQSVEELTDNENILKIFGDSTDKVELEGNWIKDNDASNDEFNVYQGGTDSTSNIKVMIETDIEADI